MSSSLLRTALRTFGWAAISQHGRQVLQLASIIVLARLLSPQDFGLMSIATVVTGFLMMFRDMGTGAALIHRPVADARLVGSLFSLNALLGVLGGLLTAAAAPAIAAFFEAPVLEPVLLALAIPFAIAGLSVVPQAVLEREGRFDRLARIELGGTAAGVATGVALAWYGWGIWSLVGQATVTTLVTTAFMAACARVAPALRPDWKLLRSVAGYSTNLTGFNVFNYFVRNADNMIIGKLLGPHELGFYALAYQIAINPVRAVGAVVGRVLFPALSRVQQDRAAAGRTYLQSSAVLVSVCFPAMALLIALAPGGTTTLLGEEWRPMIPILLVLGVVGFVQSMMITNGPIYMANGRTGALMLWGLATGVAAIAAFLVGAQWGALGVALGYAIFTFAAFYPCLAIPLRWLDLRVRDVLREAASPAVGSLLAGVAAWAVVRVLEGPLGTLAALASGALAGLLLYALWLKAGYAGAGRRAPIGAAGRRPGASTSANRSS